MRRLLHLSLGKKIIIGIVILLIFTYIGLTVYLKIIAKNLMHTSIQNIETLYPQIQNISYESSRFTPYDLLTENLNISNITIRFKQSSTIWHIDHIKVHNFMGLKKNPFGSFDLSFNHLTVNSAQNLYPFIIPLGNSYNQLTAIPALSHPMLNGELNYNAPAHQLTLSLHQFINNTPILNLQMTLNSLSLNRKMLSNQTAFLNAMSAATISNLNYQLNFDQIFTLKDIANQFPTLGFFLQNLGYTTLPVHIDLTSNYQGGQNQEDFHADINIRQFGQLALNWTLLYSAPLSPYNLASYFFNTENSNMPEVPPLIQSANMTYTDQSFINRLFNYLANLTQQPVATIQTEIQNILLSYAAQTNIPEFTSISNAIANFIANPGSITFNFNPAIPFGFNTISDFFAAQQQLNNFLNSANMNNLTGEQRDALFDRYKTVTSQAYSAFFNKIGLSVITNSGS